MTYFSVLLAKVIIPAKACVHFIWSSHGYHVLKEKGGVLVGVTMASSATRLGKFAAIMWSGLG